MIRKTLGLCLCVLGLAVPMALAQTPSQSGYGETPVVPEPQTPVVPEAQSADGHTGAPDGHTGAPDGHTGAPDGDTGAPDGDTGAPDGDPSADSLPFTGMDIAVIVLVAGVLLGAGVGLRRATASPSRS